METQAVGVEACGNQLIAGTFNLLFKTIDSFQHVFLDFPFARHRGLEIKELLG